MSSAPPPGGSTAAAPAGAAPQHADAVFVRERARLVGLAYRMLGILADAEDVVGDAYLRWREVDLRTIDNPAAYLTTMVTRRSLDRLRAQARRRTAYPGPWLPEPLPTEGPPDPAESVVMAESLELGFLTVLDRLEPAARAAFLLREVFGEPYATVAAAIDRSEVACRQLVHRAKQQLQDERATRQPVAPERQRELLRAFGRALESGRADELRACLTDDVVLLSDGGPTRRAARHPVVGAHRVSRFLLGVSDRLLAGAEATRLEVNHEPAVLLHARGRPRLLAVFELAPEGIRGFRLVLNPEKLATVSRHVLGERAEAEPGPAPEQPPA